jgi:hypothetical protein
MFEPANEEETETTETEESVEGPEGASMDAGPVEDAPAVFDWNGELDALSKADWFGRVGDEGLRNTLIRGFESKYRNFERGFTKAFQDTAARRKEIERREAKLREDEMRIQRWMTGDADPMAEKQREIDQLRAAHNAALETLRNEYEQAQRRAAEEWTGKYGTAERERDELRQRLESFEYEAKQAEERQIEQAVTEVEDWLKSEAADVYDNDDAFYAFTVLCTGGLDPEDAVTMVRAKFGPPPEPEPEPVPEAMNLMNLGPSRGTGTTQMENRSYKEIMDSMRRAAQADESQFYNPRR